MRDVPNVLNQFPDDPRLLLSEPFRAVHFVYGLFHPAIPALPGRAVLGALAALGFGDEAARGILLRLRRGGFIESTRAGRTAAYALAPRSVALIDEISRRTTEPPPPWDGTFDALLVRIPGRDRAFREQLRRHAAFAGFGSPVPGLLLSPGPGPMAMLEPLLTLAPSGAVIVRARLTPSPDDARALAGDAWDLRGLGTRLRAETTRLERAATEASALGLEGGAALARLWDTIGPLFELLSENRPLPAALLPDDWPLDAAHAAFVRVAMVLAGPARRYVEDLAVPP